MGSTQRRCWIQTNSQCALEAISVLCYSGEVVLKPIYLAAMKFKSIFDAILTELGVAGLVHAANLYVNDTDGFRALLVYGLLGFTFFFLGVGVIRKSQPWLIF